MPVPTHAAARGGSPILLTVTGAIDRTNRGAFDPTADILMGKQNVRFERAYAVDYAALAALPARRFSATLEYDQKPHALAGPLLQDVLHLAGARLRDETELTLRAVDGYAPVLRVADARRRAYIVATHIDGKPLALGGLGPLWAVYEADRFPDVAARPVKERFGQCPWALYHIDVAATK